MPGNPGVQGPKGIEGPPGESGMKVMCFSIILYYTFYVIKIKITM